MTVQSDAARAFAALKVGAPQEAERLIAPHVKDNAPLALHVLGLVRKSQGSLGDAEDLIRRSLQGDPRNAAFHHNLALVLYAAGFFERAAESCRTALALRPDFAIAARSLGRALIDCGGAQEAEDIARTQLARSPNAEAFDLLSCALRAQGRSGEALEASDAALALQPHNAGVRHNRGLALSALGRSKAALDTFEALAAEGVRAPALCLNHARALIGARRDAHALAVLEAGLAQWPDDAALHTALAQARWLRGDGDDFVDAFERAIVQFPERTALKVACADLLRRADLHARAQAHLDAALLQRPDDAAVLAACGVVLDESGSPDEALAPLARACAKAPEAAPIRAAYAHALLRSQRPEEALAQIAPMRAARPHDQAWIGLETLALRMTGDVRCGRLCDYESMIGVFTLEPPPGFATIEDFNARFGQALRRLHGDAGHPLDQTLRQGSQTRQDLRFSDDPVIRAFLEAVRAPIRDYVAAMPHDAAHPLYARKGQDFRIAGAWSALLRAGGAHVNHVHPAGWISSAYYVEVPQDLDADAHEGWLSFGAPRWPIAGCSAERFIEPKAGRLVLFPSYFWHGVTAFARGERMTAPFDVVPA
ncbi:MAG: tetratricopeptide repeat protein [Alphaproteobacteria bacterium]|nr:tetratricopeptide repeat protein [Alphaproteobacteria bacterium]